MGEPGTYSGRCVRTWRRRRRHRQPCLDHRRDRRLLAEPSSDISILADNDGAVDRYGVEFGVANLDRTPEEVSASVQVTASNGERHTIELLPTGILAARGRWASGA